jgi:hypothetical protein
MRLGGVTAVAPSSSTFAKGSANIAGEESDFDSGRPPIGWSRVLPIHQKLTHRMGRDGQDGTPRIQLGEPQLPVEEAKAPECSSVEIHTRVDIVDVQHCAPELHLFMIVRVRTCGIESCEVWSL